jgi:hypothetical protein
MQRKKGTDLFVALINTNNTFEAGSKNKSVPFVALLSFVGQGNFRRVRPEISL